MTPKRDKAHAQHKDASPRSLARACAYCRVRKIRCDTARPRCATCAHQDRECSYHVEAPRRRPTLAQINALREDKAALQAFIDRLKSVSAEEREDLLLQNQDQHPTSSFEVSATTDPEASHTGFVRTAEETTRVPIDQPARVELEESRDVSSDEDLDVAPFISVDAAGHANSFGPSSALHVSPKAEVLSCPQTQGNRVMATEHMRNTLIANAALQRQNEHELMKLRDIDGVPTELALHLLNLHWSRQHHTLLLTYRPAVMRDIGKDTPYCSKFLLNALFACSSKFSQRLEVRDDPAVPATCGRKFFRRCDELLAKESLLIHPTLPTVVGLLYLGLTYNARGETSKGWLYTGYALRMVYDLGLHIDRGKSADADPEEIEVRRRIFWGAFICDKLQSLYLGRPVMINLRDAHVSRHFMDTFEEKELWTPYLDPKGEMTQVPIVVPPMPLHSVSTFQRLCSLSKIMTGIITKFYVVGATPANAKSNLQRVDKALQDWKDSLPSEIQYEPWLQPNSPAHYPPPNCMTLHCNYHALIILLHRPFISDGHLRSASTPVLSWKRCTSAARSITSIATSYQTAYTLISAPYMLSYAIYVACTIHVRNAAAEAGHGRREQLSLLRVSLKCLEQLSSANLGVSKAASIIKQLMAANKVVLDTKMDEMTAESEASVDLDGIFNTFPTQQVPHTSDFGVQNFDDTPNLAMDFLTDPLYGLMDQPVIPYSDMSQYLLADPND